MARFHGFGERILELYPLGVTAPTGKFGRMFPALRPFRPSKESLTELGMAMTDGSQDDPAGDNLKVPAGYTYLGQFIDHDITFDTTGLQEIQVDPMAVTNFRTPSLELDSVYGLGPSTQPYLYQLAGGFSPQELFAIGSTNSQPGGGDGSIKPSLPNDLPRAASGLAIIGDPRNDENLIVAQLHLAFLKFHNKIVEGLKNGSIERRSPIRKSIFEEARDLVRWHYQWIVLNDFLRRLIDGTQLDHVLQYGRRFYQYTDEPFIPVEFSVAAYRLGHSMIRSVYDYNRVFTPRPGGVTPATLQLLFAFTGKSGSADDPFPVPIPSDWIIDWRRFFELDSSVPVQASRKLDPFLVDPLKDLPNVPEPRSLAVRNLLRGSSMGLPTGQSIARRMRLTPLSPAQIATGSDGAVAKKHGFDQESPLWYYILKEAQIQGQGLRLGQVGSRILAEVFVGLLEGDSNAYLSSNPDWRPRLPAAVPGTFTMVDLLRFVDDLSPIDDPANLT